jgi:hypothetical protein
MIYPISNYNISIYIYILLYIVLLYIVLKRWANIICIFDGYNRLCISLKCSLISMEHGVTRFGKYQMDKFGSTFGTPDNFPIFSISPQSNGQRVPSSKWPFCDLVQGYLISEIIDQIELPACHLSEFLPEPSRNWILGTCFCRITKSFCDQPHFFP